MPTLEGGGGRPQDSGAWPRDEVQPFRGSERRSRFTPGEIFAGRYRIIDLLGSGGMGEVYRATDVILHVEVALKFISKSLEAEDIAIQRLREEVKAARGIVHPNVRRVYDIGEEGDVHFISMEYVAGDTLSQNLRRMGRISRDKACSISHQVCASLEAVHQKGLLHRDLKPSNILLNETGNVVLSDFGLAASIGEQSSGGTPAYMAPELWHSRESSTASDIYAL
ncbi:MAG: serine/threonine-protein kinase, partial [Acidobacteriota bacterium]